MNESSDEIKDNGMPVYSKINNPSQKLGGQVFWFSIGTAIILAAGAADFLIELIQQAISGLFSWQLLTLALVFMSTSIVTLAAGLVKPIKSIALKAILISSSSEIALLSVSTFVPGMGIPAALIGLLYSTIITFALLQSLSRGNPSCYVCNSLKLSGTILQSIILFGQLPCPGLYAIFQLINECF